MQLPHSLHSLAVLRSNWMLFLMTATNLDRFLLWDVVGLQLVFLFRECEDGRWESLHLGGQLRDRLTIICLTCLDYNMSSSVYWFVSDHMLSIHNKSTWLLIPIYIHCRLTDMLEVKNNRDILTYWAPSKVVLVTFELSLVWCCPGMTLWPTINKENTQALG